MSRDAARHISYFGQYVGQEGDQATTGSATAGGVSNNSSMPTISAEVAAGNENRGTGTSNPPTQANPVSMLG